LIIDGKQIAKKIRKNIHDKVKQLDRAPNLVVILVGNDPASAVYVRNKENACIEVGFSSEKIVLPESITQEDLLANIKRLNNDDLVDGILVQLPLPKHLDPNQVIENINYAKDVDGFNSRNIGELIQNRAILRPCTPKGVMTMLKEINIDLAGKDVTMVGASNIVGRPLAIELLNAGATVTICNSKTKDLKNKVKRADIVAVAVGRAEMINGDWIKDGAIVIDVGINRLDDGRLVGDVDFNSIKDKASWITPVPGGVGPMTIATLLENTLIAYNARNS
jgi:methylenetetrahydrofolate dehydrogenase (NADP+)/methenyltetrahydrofolate cyclohydrolase